MTDQMTLRTPLGRGLVGVAFFVRRATPQPGADLPDPAYG
jgi:hypothetical protein